MTFKATLNNTVTKVKGAGFYLSPFPMGEEFLVLKAVNRFSLSGSDDVPVIPSDSLISVEKNMVAIVTDSCEVIDVFTDPGEHIYKNVTGQGTYLYYINMQTIRNNTFQISIPTGYTEQTDNSPTSLVVDGFFNFRICDPEKFFTSVRWDLACLRTRDLTLTLVSDLKTVFHKLNGEVVLPTNRSLADSFLNDAEMNQLLCTCINSAWSEYGIKITRISKAKAIKTGTPDRSNFSHDSESDYKSLCRELENTSTPSALTKMAYRFLALEHDHAEEKYFHCLKKARQTRELVDQSYKSLHKVITFLTLFIVGYYFSVVFFVGDLYYPTENSSHNWGTLGDYLVERKILLILFFIVFLVFIFAMIFSKIGLSSLSMFLINVSTIHLLLRFNADGILLITLLFALCVLNIFAIVFWALRLRYTFATKNWC